MFLTRMSHVYRDCIFTTHALERLKQRSISEYAVADTVSYPDKKFPDGKNTKFIKMIGGRKHHVVAHWKPADHKWLIVSAWVRGEDDSQPLYLQLLFAPFKLVWWLLKRFVVVRLLLFILVACAMLFLWYTTSYAQLYAYEFTENSASILDETNYPRSYFLSSLAKKTIGVTDSDSETDKIYKIARYLDAAFSYLRTKPVTVSAYESSPEELFRILRDEKTGIYCTHFSRMFVALAQEVGLTSRLVHLTRGEQQHTVAEVYLNEYKQWGTVDIQYNAALMFDADSHQPLNVVELAQQVQEDKQFFVVTSGAVNNEDNKQNLSAEYAEYLGTGVALEYEQKPQAILTNVYLSKKYLQNISSLFTQIIVHKISFS